MGKNLSCKYSQKLLDHGKQSARDALKTASKKQFKKQQKKLVTWLVVKLLIKLQKPKKSHDKYLEKDVFLRKKYRKLLII